MHRFRFVVRLYVHPSSRSSALIFVFLRLRLETGYFSSSFPSVLFPTETTRAAEKRSSFIQRIETTNEIRGRSCYLHSARLFIFFSERERERERMHFRSYQNFQSRVQNASTRNAGHTRVISAQNVACNLFRRRFETDIETGAATMTRSASFF